MSSTPRRAESLTLAGADVVPSRLFGGVAIALFLLAALVTCYWPTVARLAADWRRDEDYSVGQLVPLVAIYLVWHERHALARLRWRPCGWGAWVIVLAQMPRYYGLMWFFESAERYSLVLTVAGLVLLVAGWQVFRQLFWVLAFLLLMVPLPGQVHNLISGPLQNIATAGAVFLLELFGATVSRQGNIIELDYRVPLAVAEACSGLRMLTAFLVVAATLAYVVNRPRWQKIVLLASSIPVAIFCNLMRLFVTAQLYRHTSDAVAERFFHDFAGLTMMPLAVMLLAGELWVMNRLVTDTPDAGQSRHEAVRLRRPRAR